MIETETITDVICLHFQVSGPNITISHTPAMHCSDDPCPNENEYWDYSGQS